VLRVFELLTKNCFDEPTIMPIPRLNPKLMAIGDSLPQGCRHLTVKASYCAQSWPARIAQLQGWDFAAPDHHDPVLFDLEEEIRRLDPIFLSPANLAFVGLPGRIRANFARWQQQPGGSKFEAFDNLAVAGAKVHDLYSLTSARANDEVNKIIASGSDNILARTGDLHLPINARFVLNPQQKPEFMDFSALDWVEKRQPETLLVHCGHNHGLFGFGFEARDQPSVTQGDHDGIDYFGQWKKVSERLAALPASVKNILVVLLPKVGAVAALHPTSNQRVNGYAAFYAPRIIPTSRTLSGTRVAEVDSMIRDTNVRIEKVIRDSAKQAGTEMRLKFLDAYASLEALDFKNSLDTKRRLKLTGNQLIDNRYLDGKPNFPIFTGALIAGGYLSIDGMHASGVGYADVASHAMQALGLPHSATDRMKLLRRAFDEDSLLSKYPLELDGLIQLIDLARTFINANHFIPTTTATLADDTHIAVSLPMLARAFTW
jgi:hypothetical protein